MVMSSVTGLTVSPSRCCFQLPLGSSSSRCSKRVSNLPGALKPAGNNVLLRLERYSSVEIKHVGFAFCQCGLFLCVFGFLKLNRSCWAGVSQRLNARRTPVIKCAMDASFGDMSDKPTGTFFFTFLCFG